MESAVPAHLARERTTLRRVDDTFSPPYPAWVARFADSVEGVVMAYFGVQSAAALPPEALAPMLDHMRAPDAPQHVDRARYRDEAGYDTQIAIAYWNEPERFDRWFAAFRTYWDSPSLGDDGFGYFVELVRPRVEHFETLFSTLGRPEGVSVLSSGMSEPVVEHAYWGSARERLPVAQVDDLRAEDATLDYAAVLGRRIRLRPQPNLCLIRSGQDWSDTAGDERDLYVRDVEPALRAGMTYLRDEGLAIGCYDCRYADVVGPAGEATERTFGLAYFRDLVDMERWAESHPTHVEIFGRFMASVQRLEFNIALRLYHEVTIASADEQFFEYVNCHPKTGLLKGALSSAGASANMAANST